MSLKYFVVPTSLVIENYNPMLGVDVNYNNSRCENAGIFIRNFTLAILVKKDADLSFIQKIDENLRNSIQDLKTISETIQAYSKEKPFSKDLQTIVNEINVSVSNLNENSNKVAESDLERLGYVNSLNKINTIIDLVRNLVDKFEKSLDVTNDIYKNLAERINTIVKQINDFIEKSESIAQKLKEILYSFNTDNQEENRKYENLNNLRKPNDHSYYFKMDMYYDYDNLQRKSDFNEYFLNLESESQLTYNYSKNILLKSCTNKFTDKLDTEHLLDCKLWIVPISTFLLLKAFTQVNTQPDKDLIESVDKANTSYSNYVQGAKNLYEKKVFIHLFNDRVALSKNTAGRLETDEMNLLWPKKPSGDIKTSLTFEELILDHFKSAKSNDTLGRVIGFRGPRYETKILKFINDNPILSLKRVNQEAAKNSPDYKYDKSIEGLIDRINGFTGSKNSRLVRKITILAGEYIIDKFKFSLYEGVSSDIFYSDSQADLVKKIAKEDDLLSQKENYISKKIKDNKKIVKDIGKQLDGVINNIKKIDDILNSKIENEDNLRCSHIGIRKSNILSLSVLEEESEEDESNNTGSVVIECNYEEQKDEDVIEYYIEEQRSFDEYDSNLTLAKRINTYLGLVKISVLGVQKNVDIIMNALINPINDFLQYDQERIPIVRSSLMGYFVSIMYMSLPYHKCITKRNAWDLYHVPRSKIIFVSNAASWYYKAYLSICREIYYILGPAINATMDTLEAQRKIVTSLNKKIKSTDIKVGYANAYQSKKLIDKDLNKIGSLVSYITSVYVYDGKEQKIDFDNSSQYAPIVEQEMSDFEEAQIEKMHINRNGSFDEGAFSDESIKWMKGINLLGMEGIDYSIVTCQALSFTYNNLKGDVGYMFQTFNKALFSKYTSNMLNINQAFSQNLNKDLNIETYFDSNFIKVITGITDKRTALFASTIGRGNKEDYLADSIKFLISTQLIYLKTIKYKYSLQKKDQWGKMINPVVDTLKRSGSEFYKDPKGKGYSSYMKNVLPTVIDRFNQFSVDRLDKPKNNEWDGWHGELTTKNQKETIVPYITGTNDFIANMIFKYINKDTLLIDDILDQIKNIVNSNNIINKNPYNDFVAYVDSFKKQMAEKQIPSSSVISLAVSLTFIAMALLLRIILKKGMKEKGVEYIRRKNPYKSTNILIYYLDFLIFCANLTNRLLMAHRDIIGKFQKINEGLYQSKIVKDTGISFMATFTILQSLNGYDNFTHDAYLLNQQKISESFMELENNKNTSQYFGNMEQKDLLDQINETYNSEPNQSLANNYRSNNQRSFADNVMLQNHLSTTRAFESHTKVEDYDSLANVVESNPSQSVISPNSNRMSAKEARSGFYGGDVRTIDPMIKSPKQSSRIQMDKVKAKKSSTTFSSLNPFGKKSK